MKSIFSPLALVALLLPLALSAGTALAWPASESGEVSESVEGGAGTNTREEPQRAHRTSRRARDAHRAGRNHRARIRAGNGTHDGLRSVGLMAGRLGLTTQQRREIRALAQAARAERRAQRDALAALSPAARRAARMTAQAELQTVIFASLTEAQRAQLRGVRAERRALRAEARSQRHVRPETRSQERGRGRGMSRPID